MQLYLHIRVYIPSHQLGRQPTKTVKNYLQYNVVWWSTTGWLIISEIIYLGPRTSSCNFCLNWVVVETFVKDLPSLPIKKICQNNDLIFSWKSLVFLESTFKAHEMIFLLIFITSLFQGKLFKYPNERDPEAVLCPTKQCWCQWCKHLITTMLVPSVLPRASSYCKYTPSY